MRRRQGSSGSVVTRSPLPVLWCGCAGEWTRLTPSLPRLLQQRRVVRPPAAPRLPDWRPQGDLQTFTRVDRSPDTLGLTSGGVRAASVRLLDHDYLISSVSERDMEWGLKRQWRSESRLRFADPARTVIDILDSPRLGGGCDTVRRSSPPTLTNTTRTP